MSPVVKRFLQIIDHLILINKVKSTRDFCIKIKMGTANITELRKGRNKDIGTKFLSALIKKFNINGHWLLTGEGDIYIDREDNELKSLLKRAAQLQKDNNILRRANKKAQVA